MNKMQMTITKEKKITTHTYKLQHKKAPVNKWTLKNTRITLWKNVAAVAVSKFVRRDLFWWQRTVEAIIVIIIRNEYDYGGVMSEDC